VTSCIHDRELGEVCPECLASTVQAGYSLPLSRAPSGAQILSGDDPALFEILARKLLEKAARARARASRCSASS
jgi:hypothetical protein